MSAPTPAEICLAYRQLYRSALRAVQFSKPARYTLRDQLRAAFRDVSGASGAATRPPQQAVFDPKAIRRTVWFLNAAAETRGLEHRIVRNLLKTAYWRQKQAAKAQPSWAQITMQAKSGRKAKEQSDIERTAYDHYDQTIQMLNETMCLCLR